MQAVPRSPSPSQGSPAWFGGVHANGCLSFPWFQICPDRWADSTWRETVQWSGSCSPRAWSQGWPWPFYANLYWEAHMHSFNPNFSSAISWVKRIPFAVECRVTACADSRMGAHRQCGLKFRSSFSLLILLRTSIKSRWHPVSFMAMVLTTPSFVQSVSLFPTYLPGYRRQKTGTVRAVLALGKLVAQSWGAGREELLWSGCRGSSIP